MVLGDEPQKKDEVPVVEPKDVIADPDATSTTVAPATQAAPAPEKPKHQQAGGVGDTKEKGESVFGKASKCAPATSCSACAAQDSDNCFWNSALSECMIGDPIPLMCLLDSLPKNVGALVGLGVGGVLLLVSCVACGVCAYKKRQSAAQEAAVDPDEAFESREPLAPGASSSSRSFLRRDADDEVETF